MDTGSLPPTNSNSTTDSMASQPSQTSSEVSSTRHSKKSHGSGTVLVRTSRSSSTRQLTSVESAFCGATAGVVSRVIVSPFDVVKITLQLETRRSALSIPRGLSNSVVTCVRQIMQKEGVRGFFKGNLSAEYLYLTYGATQFLVFGAVESWLGRASGLPKQARSFVGGALAGAIATSTTYPFDLLRTRFIAQQLSSRVNTSILGALRHIHHEEGLRGFYRGLWPACLQIMPYMGIVFTSYDALASGYRWARARSNSRLLQAIDPVQDAVVGASAAVIGKTCVYPLDLVRKRLQIQGPHLTSYAFGGVPKYTGMVDALAYIVRHEGFPALFRGLTPALIKAAPASAAVFFVFGHTRDMLLTARP
ncbi:mitochondrial thiamine pyrophosphate transporter [Coemansia guatemalensis]|uniref:Mitochondrial thiamine pyrophosphate transporter n=1 Tax=Coemansia guatemalensis TaxID=2761395 RepID=A0A9W8I7L6_9FUNG|nr:mitochondrial thiamine pyrophosphate transporter [Coemansia guatemalensis]